jgi:hypothetical protein
MRNATDKSGREAQNRHDVVHKGFFNCVVYDIMWKNAVEDRPQKTAWHMHIACQILRICNTYCFSTATMVP